MSALISRELQLAKNGVKLFEREQEMRFAFDCRFKMIDHRSQEDAAERKDCELFVKPSDRTIRVRAPNSNKGTPTADDYFTLQEGKMKAKQEADGVFAEVKKAKDAVAKAKKVAEKSTEDRDPANAQVIAKGSEDQEKMLEDTRRDLELLAVEIRRKAV